MPVSGKTAEHNDSFKNQIDFIRLKKSLLSKAELSIWLDSYEDIFSDFDSRPFEERALSDDFIHEAHKMAKEKPSGHIELKLLIPLNVRNKELEEVITRSLHSHFRFFANQLRQEMKVVKQRGMLLAIMGVIILTSTAYLVNLPVHSFLLNVLRITMEPFGLFLVWTGLEAFLYKAYKKKPERDFNTKMAHADIQFLSI